MVIVFCRFDVKNANINDSSYETMKPENVPDVVSAGPKLFISQKMFQVNFYGILRRGI